MIRIYIFNVICSENEEVRHFELLAKNKLEAMHKMYNVCIVKQWLSYEYVGSRKNDKPEERYKEENKIIEDLLKTLRE